MEPQRTTKEKHKPGASFRETFNRLTFFTFVASMIVLFTPLAPGVRPLVPSALGYTLFTWSLICGLPLAWEHRAVWVPRFVAFMRSMKRGGKAAVALIPDIPMPTMDQVKPAVLPDQAPSLQNTGAPSALPAPFNMLPVNGHPSTLSAITPEAAAEAIGSAMQLAGISFEGEVQVIAVDAGPTMHTVHFNLPPRVQPSTITKKRDDIATHLNMFHSLDIKASRFKSAVAFVMPNETRSWVYMRDLIPAFLEFAKTAMLPVILGMDMEGKPVFTCMTKFPHLLLAGTTGSGKSVELNTIVESLLTYNSPQKVQLIMIDPKKVEFNAYQGYPHLMMPVVTDPRRASIVLKKLVAEMDRRYDVFAQMGVRNILQYNNNSNTPLPYIVMIIDEMADLMMLAAADVEDSVTRLAQLARAAGIHMVIGTQRPSVDIITGVIKANLPTRMAFQMNSRHDYATVMERKGPPLLGKGDGVFVLAGGQDIRFQSAAISVDDDETTEFIEKVKLYWQQNTVADVPQMVGIDANEELEEENGDRFIPDEEDGNQYSLNMIAVQPSTIPAPPRMRKSENVPTVPAPSASEFTPSIPTAADSEKLPDTKDIFNMELEEIPYPEDTYANALQIAADHGGINVDLLKINMGISFEKATSYIGEMHAAGLLGDFIDGKREYIGDQGSRLNEEDLLEAVKRQILETRRVSSEGLSKQFRIQKKKMIDVLRQLAAEGVLNRPETNGSGYTIAWNEQDIEYYLNGDRDDDMPY